MLAVVAGSSGVFDSKREAMPLGGIDVQAMDASHSATTSSSSSGPCAIGGDTGGDNLSVTQAPSRGAGYGLEEASGIATKNTRAPHKTPPTPSAACEIRSAERPP